MRPYADTVEQALRLALRLSPGGIPEPPPEARTLIVAFAADQGLAGNYSDGVVTSAMALAESLPGEVDTICIGYRALELMRLRGVEPLSVHRAPGSIEGIVSEIPDLAAQVFTAYRERGAEQLYFVYSRYESLGRYEQMHRRVLPPESELVEGAATAEAGYPPLLTAPAEQVLGHFLEEYFFVEFNRALLEGHASENGARLASMTSAASNIDERLDDLTQQYQSERQTVITSELLDVVSGAEAQREED
jgi:F-type H+-transporting ATPase subunit gamma